MDSRRLSKHYLKVSTRIKDTDVVCVLCIFIYIMVFLDPIMWFDYYYFTEDLKDNGNVDFNFYL